MTKEQEKKILDDIVALVTESKEISPEAATICMTLCTTTALICNAIREASK